MIGSHISHYAVLDRIGAGGMGVVYRARDERLGREVAIKVLPPELALDHDRLRRFEREARAAGAISHPNILTVYEIDHDGGRPFLVTELLEGESLRAAIDQRTVTPRRAVEIGRQIAAGLAAAHECDVIHRDLKPGNLFLTRYGVVKILDFGLAKLVQVRSEEVEETWSQDASTEDGTILGTPGYMAPEQIRAQDLDHRTDLFAAGVVLYELISGRHPFGAGSRADLTAAILRDDPPALPELVTGLPEAVWRVVRRCIEKRPDDRFRSARELEFALESILEEWSGGFHRPSSDENRSTAGTRDLLSPMSPHLPPERPLFVTREAELATLETAVAGIADGQPGFVFVAGEAGAGKTSLVVELVRRTLARTPEVVVTLAGARAHTGVGDAFAPWRDVLGQLAADDSTLPRLDVTTELKNRLRTVAPHTLEALVERGPDLVDVLIPSTKLLDQTGKLELDSACLGRLEDLAMRKTTSPHDGALQQVRLFLQVGEVIARLVQTHPLLVVIEDLHWADKGSIELLGHLVEVLGDSRVALVATYRPEEVSIGRGDHRHPLTPVLHTAVRHIGACSMDLAPDTAFVDAFLDTAPNRLGATFRSELGRLTGGHALYTVELLRALQDRQLIVLDSEGSWVEGASIEWDLLPARVEAVIAERVERLDPDLRELLVVAAVEGETFSAEVLARFLGTSVRQVIRKLSGDLEKRHRLVVAQGVSATTEGRRSTYTFGHALIQHYVYHRLDDVERAELHEGVGLALEGLYGDQAEVIAPQLARHFQEAGHVDRATFYLLAAGRQCVRATASEEGIAHFQRALDLLATSPQSVDRDNREIELLMALLGPLPAARGFSHPEVQTATDRLLDLAEHVADDWTRLMVMWLGVGFYGCTARKDEALELGLRMLPLARSLEATDAEITAHYALGYTYSMLGRYPEARQSLEWVVANYESAEHSRLASLHNQDPAVTCLCHLSYVLTTLGDLDRGRACGRRAREAAQQLDKPNEILWAEHFSSWAEFIVRTPPDQTRLDRDLSSLRLAEEHGLQLWILWFHGLVGYWRTVLGDGDEGLAEATAAYRACHEAGMVATTCLSLYVGLGCLAAGRFQDALATMDESLTFAASFHERFVDPWLHAVRGRALLGLGRDIEAEAAITTGMQLARNRGHRLWELHSALAMADLRRAQGNDWAAVEVLRPVLDSFGEDIDIAPLREGRAMLVELQAQKKT